MAGKANRRGRQQTAEVAGGGVVKVTFRLSDLTAKRLGVEAVMTKASQSDIVERVLSAYLSGWRLPSKVGAEGGPAEGNEGAAA